MHINLYANGETWSLWYKRSPYSSYQWIVLTELMGSYFYLINPLNMSHYEIKTSLKCAIKIKLPYY